MLRKKDAELVAFGNRLSSQLITLKFRLTIVNVRYILKLPNRKALILWKLIAVNAKEKGFYLITLE